ncbi:Ger(x)C family spore germination protein [Paenibacillus sp. SYP-B3998]|uniref:Ger(X)C family spore germination protein n=1 Tax=Paenibacillus sp. SYP-B3998 TaxID=2678564 RepID=A0A6G4A5F9_9BACL|nr:Ger(x)C family spore germination protein [Paenibacillus sp. SYP-B3998]NEW09061.1 Ger(x)C family spore germination protein [Paenibacillus sp. SYP-B3998]
MKNKLRILLAAVLIVWLPGCSEAVDLENLTLGLVIGVDLDEHNQLVSYFSSPLFNKNVSKSTLTLESNAKTLRATRREFDSMATGLAVGGKTQVILIGKRLMQHGDWFSLFDVFFRDAKNSLSERVIAVDGDVSEIMQNIPQDMPPLSLHLASLIDTKELRNETVKTNLQQFDKQMFEKGITPYISLIKVENERIKLTGTALLDKKGRLVMTLDQNETTLLRILQNSSRGQQSLSASIPGAQKSDIYDKNNLTFSINSVKNKMKTGYRDGKFEFDIKLNMFVSLKERLFTYDMRKNREKLEQQIQEQIKKQFEELIKKCQKNQIDPIGLGQYARAYQYKKWKQVQEHWGETFSEADVHLSVKTNIKYMGPVK